MDLLKHGQKKRKNLLYTEEKMRQALIDARNGISIKKAAKNNGVPRITLLYKLKGKNPEGRRIGAPTVFSAEEEDILVQWVLGMSARGFPVSKELFISSVKKVARKLEKDAFQTKEPSNKWFYGFMGRHKELSSRVAQNLTKSRASVSMEELRNWSVQVKKCLEEKGVFDVLESPARVFNADETAFFLNPKGGKVLATKGQRAVYQKSGDNEKACITVLVNGNANGDMAPPMIVLKYQRVPGEIEESLPRGWARGKSDRGWMTQELWFEYIANVFNPWLDREGITKPVILFVDGHSSHISIEVSDFCMTHGIELIALFPNSTHILQPMDVAVFRNLKREWKDAVQDWRLANDNCELKKKDFCKVLKAVLEKCFTQKTLANGFKACGLVPFDIEAVRMPSFDQPTATQHVNGAITQELPKQFLAWLKGLIGDVENADPALIDLWCRANAQFANSVNKDAPLPNAATPSGPKEADANAATEEMFTDDFSLLFENDAMESFIDVVNDPLLDETSSTKNQREEPGVEDTPTKQAISTSGNNSVQLPSVHPPWPVSPYKLSFIDKVNDPLLDETGSTKDQREEPGVEDTSTKQAISTSGNNSVQLQSFHPPWLVSPYKSCLIWPRADPKTGKMKVPKDGVPPVITSDLFHMHANAKAAQAKKVKEDIERKKQERLKKKRKMEEDKEKKKQERLEKKKKKKADDMLKKKAERALYTKRPKRTKKKTPFKDFILVKFVTEEDQREKFYVGEINGEAKEAGVDVLFFRKKTGKIGTFFSFPEVRDEGFVEYYNIIARLSEYNMNRDSYVFPNLGNFVDLNKVH